MKVFISWSGNTSHKIAQILRDWLPTVIHYIEPWVSSEDIKKGDRWSIELSKQLDETNFGIICVDSTNANSPWLNFEAGALSKSLENGKVFPVLFGIMPAELKGPISQFQVTSFEKEDFYRLIRNLNQTSTSVKIEPERLFRSFEIAWNGLLTAIKDIPSSPYKAFQSVEIVNSEEKTIQEVTNSLQSIKFKIIYIDDLAENAVSVKKTMTKAGCVVRLNRLDKGSVNSKTSSWNGVLFYRSPDLLESAVEAKNLIGKLWAKTIQAGGWEDDGDDLIFWLSERNA